MSLESFEAEDDPPIQEDFPGTSHVAMSQCHKPAIKLMVYTTHKNGDFYGGWFMALLYHAYMTHNPLRFL